jgi:hypothetical protein
VLIPIRWTQVTVWRPASHALWAVWAVVQARDDILARVERWTSGSAQDVTDANTKELEAAGDDGAVDFAYLEYGEERLGMFRQDLKRLGV